MNPNRHQFRANWHDYNAGLYFVTICAYEHKCIFGKIVSETNGNQFIESAIGRIIGEHITKLPSHYDDVEILHHVVMPNIFI